MEYPNKKTIEKLLNNTHHEDIPAWSMSDYHDAYLQLKNLYEHWYRKEFNRYNNKENK